MSRSRRSSPRSTLTPPTHGIATAWKPWPGWWRTTISTSRWPCRPTPRASRSSVRGIYHEKVGIITDREGNRLSFSGSINETAGGWINNRESFHVHLSWEGGRDFKHVQDEVEAFDEALGRPGMERQGPRLPRSRQGAAAGVPAHG